MGQFLKGLPQLFIQKILAEIAASLDECYNLAMELEEIEERFAFLKESTVPRTYDVLSVEKRKFDEAERERCRKEKLCFYCREIGHMALNCPSEKATGRG